MSELENPHPRYLPNSYSPSLVRLVDEDNEFVANATVDESGWLSVTDWNRDLRKIPPRRIEEVERVTVERTSQNNTACLGIVDPGLKKRALRESGRQQTKQEAIADGGTNE